MRRVVTRIILGAWLCLVGLSQGAQDGTEWHAILGGRWRELSVPAGGHTGFTALGPAESGVGFTNTVRDADGALNRTFFNGSGVAARDVNGDGLPDLVFAGIEALELFLNLGGGRFTNATAGSGLVATNFPNRGVVLADVTGDGAPDLLLTTSGGGVRFFRNDGRAHFTDETKAAGTASRNGSMSMALADVDGNGTVDLYVANNRMDDIRDRGEVQLRMLNGQLVVPAALTNRLTVVDGQVLEYGEPDRLLLNDGTGRFHEAGWTNGTFLDEAGQPLTGPPRDWGLTATFRDFNDDGAPDLYVCNDFWTPDRMWLNDGRGHFRAAAALAFRQTSGSSMGVDLADLNGDGRPEIFVVDMLSRHPATRKLQMAAATLPPNLPGEITNRPQTLRNTFFLARPDETYAELAGYAGLTASEWAWQPVFLDVDLDGRPDLLITSGHAHDVQNRDAESLVQSRQRNLGGIKDPAERRRAFARDLFANLQAYPPLRTPVVAFWNRGDLRFEDVTSQWGTEAPGIHHGIAVADLDGDGDLDFVVNVMNGPALLYRNETSASRLAVRLRGQSSNTEAFGAVVTLRAPGLPVQRQEVVGGGRYLSGSDPQLVFATGTTAGPLELTIRWRDGTRRVVTNLGPNRLYEFVQEKALDAPPEPTKAMRPSPLFSDVSTRLPHRHHEELFDDFARQPLLPRRLSQLGPGVAWADFDGDGWEDLAIGAGAGGSLAVFRNDGQGRFVPWAWPGATTPVARDLTALVPWPRAGQPPALLAGSANYEDGRSNGSPVLEFTLDAAGPQEVLPGQTDSVGPLALADLYGDGQLELFVGGRLVPGRYPEAASSRIYRRSAGGWILDATNSATLRGIGLASGAVFTDLDGDGAPELVVACEWGPLRFFRNQHGRLTEWNPPIAEAGANRSLADLTGWWTGVSAGDFDGDGRLDLVAANWGDNPEDTTPTGKGARLWAGDWAGDGRLALVEAEWDPDRRRWTPSRPVTELAPGMPFLAGRFGTFREFSEAGLDEVLGAERATAHEFSATTRQSIVLLNRGDRFEVRPLPAEAQFTPAFAPVVADFDGDGREDVFLSQNFFATRPGVPRRDAGRGLLLLGDGQGGFAATPGAESGLSVDGEQRGAATADFDQDGRADLVVTQNGSATRLFRNQAGRPGLRVKLKGPPANPTGIGAVIQVCSGEWCGPARELHAGAGYWSTDSPVSVLAAPPGDAGNWTIRVRWPGGRRSETNVPAGAREASIAFPRP